MNSRVALVCTALACCAPQRPALAPPVVIARASEPAAIDASVTQVPDVAPTPDAALDAPASRVAPAPEAVLDALQFEHARWQRSVLYSWTTPEQVTRLAQTRELLPGRASASPHMSPFNRLLDALSSRHDAHGALARLLMHDEVLERRRYAWHAPFATVLGAGPRTYGTELLRIELREDAWVARLDPSREPPFEVTDLAQRPVPASDWQRTPRRIAAVFHLRAGAREPMHFREYIVCNEPMVRRWSVGTEAVRDELRDERAMLAWLLPFARSTRAPSGLVAYRAWMPPTRRSHREDPLVEQWQRTLAFDNERYRFRAENIEAALRGLDAHTTAATLEVRVESAP